MDQMQREKPVDYLFAVWMGVGPQQLSIMRGESAEEKLTELYLLDQEVYPLRLIRGISRGDGRPSSELIPLH